MNPHLFVYGSLMSSAGHPMGERLRREAKLLGAATLQGRLYKVAWYPGAVAGSDPGELVHGEVYALDDPAGTLAWLDEYEGIAAGSPDAGEYARVEQPARLAAGGEITASVYLYREDTAGLERIREGRWTPPSP
jgi:gamma-glutamylcyclotransferase (GGCT)/AIG2-like uncharacterized protein YtfP